MKNLKLLILFVLVVFSMGTSVEPYYGQYSPVFMLRTELEQNVKLAGPRDILNPGKIYLKDHLIFINEKYHGIHVIDNTNPEDPTNFAFINIDGCIDIAIKNKVLFADNAVDLIAVNFNSEMTEIIVSKRIKNVFPEMLSPDGYALNWNQKQARPDNAIVVRWEKTN